MNDYHVSNSKNIFCEELGLSWLKRVSILPVEKAQPIEWHAHGTIEILFCLKGVLDYEFETGPSVAIKPGQYIVIAPGVRHRLVGGMDGPSKRGSIFIARRIPLNSPETLPTRAEYHRIIRALLADPQRCRNIPKYALPIIRSLYEMIGSGKTGFELRATLLYALTVFARPSPAIQTAEDDVIPKCLEFLADNLERADALASAVGYSGYSRSRFFQLFRQHTGKTPLEHLTELRIAAVKTHLADPSCSIATAARAVGFGNLDFFRMVFKRHTGQTPSDYRAGLGPLARKRDSRT